MKQLLKLIAKQALPPVVQARLRAQMQGKKLFPPIGEVNFGDFGSTTPISLEFGYDRGSPIDRYYIESFLAQQAEQVRGRVLEIGERVYTLRFGGDHVIQSDVLHVIEGNPEATIVADLAENADHIPSDSFDCIILTQTLQMIYNVKAAVETINRILKPGGVALITIPGISYVSLDQWKDYWHWAFTTISTQKLFEEFFPKSNLQIESHGNVLSVTAFLQGLAAEELQAQELDYSDPRYPIIITLKAVKPDYKL